jgi:hypothetical protein
LGEEFRLTAEVAKDAKELRDSINAFFGFAPFAIFAVQIELLTAREALHDGHNFVVNLLFRLP